MNNIYYVDDYDENNYYENRSYEKILRIRKSFEDESENVQDFESNKKKITLHEIQDNFYM